MADMTPDPEPLTNPPMRFRRTLIAMSVFFALVVVWLVVRWSKDFWLFDALFLRSTVASGLLAALAVGGWQLLQPKQFSLRALLIAATLIAAVLIAAVLGLGVWMAS